MKELVKEPKQRGPKIECGGGGEPLGAKKKLALAFL
jgi:hypothetical protein